MPNKGKKQRFTDKQDRQAEHIAAGYEKKGMSDKKAKAIGYKTVNAHKGNKRGGKGSQH